MASLKMIYDALDEERRKMVKSSSKNSLFNSRFKDKFDIMIKVSEKRAEKGDMQERKS